jgi:hypothetical protein
MEIIMNWVEYTEQRANKKETREQTGRFARMVPWSDGGGGGGGISARARATAEFPRHAYVCSYKRAGFVIYLCCF